MIVNGSSRPIHRIHNGGSLEEALVREHEKEAGEDRIPCSNMAIS